MQEQSIVSDIAKWLIKEIFVKNSRILFCLICNKQSHNWLWLILISIALSHVALPNIALFNSRQKPARMEGEKFSKNG